MMLMCLTGQTDLSKFYSNRISISYLVSTFACYMIDVFINKTATLLFHNNFLSSPLYIAWCQRSNTTRRKIINKSSLLT